MKNIDNLIEGMKSDIYSLGKSENTALTYERAVRGFIKYLRDKFPEIENFRDVEYDHIDDYRTYCGNVKGNAMTTVNNKLTGISMFYTYLIKKKIVKNNPVIGVERPLIKKKKQTDSLTPSEVKRFLNATKSYRTYRTKPHHTKRDYAMMHTFLSLGLRANELASIKISDIDFDRKFIGLVSKGGDYDYLPLNDSLISVIQEYLKHRDNLNPKPEYKDILFISNQCCGYTNKALNEKVKLYADEARITKNIHTHSLRHTFGVNAYASTKDLLGVQEMMRHSDPKTTTIYTQQSNERLRKMANTDMYGI